MTTDRLIEHTAASRISTGNEFVSIPDISTATAGIWNIGFMHSAFRACVELHGSEASPLLGPVVEIDGERVDNGDVETELIAYWIPRFGIPSDKAVVSATVFAPLERRGFVCVLTVENKHHQDIRVKAGWRGCWQSTYHTANLSKLMSGVKYASISSWRSGVPVVEFRGHTPLFAMALVAQDALPARIWRDQREGGEAGWTGEDVAARAGVPVYYELVDEYVLKPSEKKTMPVYVGVGLEEVSAVSSAQDLQLHGWEHLFSGLRNWLAKHTIDCDDPHLRRLMNVNSFYNYFYAQATALDTEDLIVSSARSSRSNSCAAYRDRDATRWSLPAVLQINSAQARKMLIYSFTTQLANVGAHSRFIDGIVLEPGLQLDQLCAPIRALHTYVQLTEDMSVLFDRRVQTAVNTIQQILGVQRHPETALFETLLLPSGQPSRYPYICYSNVVAWRSLLDVGSLYDRIRDLDRADEANSLANQVRAAIVQNFIVPGPFGDMFAFAIDLQGNYELGDDPAGSLQLITYYGFCAPDDPVYANTVAWIHSEQNPASPARPEAESMAEAGDTELSVLSLCNDLLGNRRNEALKFLSGAELDDGVACEWVNAATGRVTRGRAFAGCAGYLAFGLRLALNALPPDAALVQQKRRVSETLYQPPPEPSQDSKKARL